MCGGGDVAPSDGFRGLFPSQFSKHLQELEVYEVNCQDGCIDACMQLLTSLEAQSS